MLPLTRSLVARRSAPFFTSLVPRTLSTFRLTCAVGPSVVPLLKKSTPCPLLALTRGRLCTSGGNRRPPLPSQDKKQDIDHHLSFDEELAKLSFFQRYKKLVKEFWYILVPVHGVTSVLWFGSCWLLVKSGVKIDLNSLVNILPFPLPQSLEDSLKNPHLGTLALTFALYKLVTPFRYMSTVYVAVPTIKTLVRKEIIKPLPKLTSSSKIQREMTRIRNRIVKKRGSDP